MSNKLNGVVIEVTTQGQTVETDSQVPHLKIIHLHGFNRISGNPPVGSKVVLEYRVSPSSGLWWGKVVS